MENNTESATSYVKLDADDFIDLVEKRLQAAKSVKKKFKIRWEINTTIPRPGYALVINTSKYFRQFELMGALAVLVVMPLTILAFFSSKELAGHDVFHAFLCGVIICLMYRFIFRSFLVDMIPQGTILFIKADNITKYDMDAFNDKCNKYMDGIVMGKNFTEKDEAQFKSCLKNMASVNDDNKVNLIVF